MNALFVLASICIIVFLLKGIYTSIDRSSEAEKPPPPPTLEDTLKAILKYFKAHLHELTIYPDSMVLYCFKNSPQDSVTDYNEIKIRFCDIGFKSIPNEDCPALQDSLRSAVGLTSTDDSAT